MRNLNVVFNFPQIVSLGNGLLQVFSQNTVLDSENMGRYGEWASTGLFPKFGSVYEKWLGLHSTVVKRF